MTSRRGLSGPSPRTLQVPSPFIVQTSVCALPSCFKGLYCCARVAIWLFAEGHKSCLINTSDQLSLPALMISCMCIHIDTFVTIAAQV